MMAAAGKFLQRNVLALYFISTSATRLTLFTLGYRLFNPSRGQIRAIASPPTAVNTTTSQGGHFQNIRSPKATSPRPKSAGE
jgi:hypothetical protein